VLTLCRSMVEAFAADPTVLEMEVNPVIVNRHGAVAVDARALVPEDAE
jgi:succinyl-CoA synthetase beta subunit